MRATRIAHAQAAHHALSQSGRVLEGTVAGYAMSKYVDM